MQSPPFFLIKKKMKKLLISFLLLIIPFSLNAGIRVSPFYFGAQNLKIGQSYSLKSLANTYISFTNTGDKKIKLEFDIYPVDEEKKFYDVLYQPIPDNSWIELETNEAILESSETAKVSFTLNIPYDIKYLGQKYYLGIRASQVPLEGEGGMVFGAVVSSFYFSISEEIPTPEEIKEIEELPASAAFQILPEEIILENISLGSISDKSFFKIINLGEINYKYEISVASPSALGLKLKDGYQDTPNCDFLCLLSDEIIVKPNQEREIPFYIAIPKKPEYAQKNFAFVIVTKLVETKVPITLWTPVYITTGGI